MVSGGFAARGPSAATGGTGGAGETVVSSSGSSSESSDEREPAGGAYQITTTGHKPTNDIERIALRQGVRAVKAELVRMQERCGFTIPVEINYADPMKTWVAAEGWGNHRGCTNEAEHGGCINLSVCGGQVVSSIWFNLCGDPGEGVKKRFRGWNTKVKKLVCRGEAAPPETSAMDHDTSRSKSSLSEDGTLTVILHPSDANVSYDFATYMEAAVEIE